MSDLVFIIDDDSSVRKSLALLLSAHDYSVKTYSSAEEFLERKEKDDGPGCLILDVNLGGKSGMQLQDDLRKVDEHFPIIFITGHASVRLSVETVKKGAINFLEKPFDEKELLTSVAEAIQLSEKLIDEQTRSRVAKSLIRTLTPREIEILKYIMSGMLNKQTAGRLNIAEHTVQLHKLSISKKLGVKSVPEMIAISRTAGVIP